MNNKLTKKQILNVAFTDYLEDIKNMSENEIWQLSENLDKNNFNQFIKLNNEYLSWQKKMIARIERKKY